MSIANEIVRIQAAKATIAGAIEGHGVIVPQGVRFSDFPALIGSIQGGTDLEAVDVSVLDFATESAVDTGVVDTAHNMIWGAPDGVKTGAAKLISTLPFGAKIRIADMFADDTSFEYVDANNPDNGVYLLFRSTATANTYSYGTAATGVAYQNSTIDTFLQNTYYQGIQSALIRNAIVLSSIKSSYLNGSTLATHTISRYIYLPDGGELGLSAYKTTEGLAARYLSTDANRVRMKQGTGTAVQYSTRTMTGAAGYYAGITTAGASVSSLSNSTAYNLVPMLGLPSTMFVYSVTNSDGSYNLVAGNKVDFTGSFGSAAARPTQALINLEVIDGAISTFLVCNNMNDSEVNRAWEPAEPNRLHTFANTKKNATDWAVGIKVVATSDDNNTVRVTAPFLVGVAA